ncbi:hypothetical protein [Rhizobium sp. PDO1-076]|uniref:hypothetical protein n=1 Tax=Rhizobium sp. PDO1-076 TaxID=1125979 RepID=UPI00114616B3|nr:hypothetical protein [Rhizobium sp. PDO1-076]
MTISVDGNEIVFRPGESGRELIVETVAGVCTDNPDFARMEIECLLKTNLSLNMFRKSIAVLQIDAMSSSAAIVVRAFFRYDDHDEHQLLDAIMDLISSAETLRGVMTPFHQSKNASAARSPQMPMRQEDIMFLRP